MHEMDNYFDELVDRLLDEQDDDTVELTDRNGNEITFEQVAVIPLDGKIYVILKPVQPLDGMKENEALAFAIDEEEGRLDLIADGETINKVFDIYDSLCEAEGNENE